MRRLLVTVLLAAAPIGSTAAQDSAWYYSTDADINGKLTQFAICHQVPGILTHDSLIVRCKGTCEAYLHIGNGIVDDQSYVLVKFNDRPAVRFAVSLGKGSDSLFFVDAFTLMRAIKNNGGYMTVQYSPYGRTPVMVKFGVWNLPPEILARLDQLTAIQRKKVQAARRQDEKQDAEHNLFCEKLKNTCVTEPDGQNCAAWKVQCSE